MDWQSFYQLMSLVIVLATGLLPKGSSGLKCRECSNNPGRKYWGHYDPDCGSEPYNKKENFESGTKFDKFDEGSCMTTFTYEEGKPTILDRYYYTPGLKHSDVKDCVVRQYYVPISWSEKVERRSMGCSCKTDYCNANLCEMCDTKGLV